MASIETIAKEFSILAPKLISQVRLSFLMKDVSTQQMTIILALHEMKRGTITKLAKRLNVSAPTITGLIDRLQRSAYVERSRSKKDRRVVFVRLTKKGTRFVAKIRKTIQKRWVQILAYLNEAEREQYLSIIKKIIEGISSEELHNA